MESFKQKEIGIKTIPFKELQGQGNNDEIPLESLGLSSHDII